MPPKRSSPDGLQGPSPSRSKQVKTENFGPEEFSKSVKKRLASSTRTGQACDRCKVRKIRCDGLPGGCSPCLQNNTECRTTDRITGRATSRGYVEGLEQRAHEMGSRIKELEAQLTSVGVEFKPFEFHEAAVHAPQLPPHPPPPPRQPAHGSVDWEIAHVSVSAPPWNRASGAPAGQQLPFKADVAADATPRTQETNIFRALPVFRTGCSGDNYLGVSSGKTYLSSIRGTALSVLGMEIDIADFDSSDMDEPSHAVFQSELYNKSYQSFLQSTLNVNPKLDKADLPPRNEGLTYAMWYFRVLNPYSPCLHRPTFMTLLTQMYDDAEFRASPAEIVMVHMVFAIMYFQYAARNVDDGVQQAEFNARSNLHYHYSLGFYYQLVASHTLQDMQALTLICLHLRNFPKPGASWMATNTALTLAIELGLHRSAKRWVQPNPQNDVLEIEMRKRVFYTILAIHVTLSGKLGRPMPLQVSDFDVELPEDVDDDLMSESGLDTSRPPGKCEFRIGIEVFKMTLLYLEMFSCIYAVKRFPYGYIDNVKALESRLRHWLDQLPDEFHAESDKSDGEARVFALYTKMWTCEFRLLLRHPSLSLTSSAEFNDESLQICVESARDMLHAVKQVQKLKSLDTTWYQGAVYLMAITTTLFARWEKRRDITAAELSNLRDEMDQWLDIMSDVGALLGSGNRLREAVRVVTDGTIVMLGRSMNGEDVSTTAERNGSRSPKPELSTAGNEVRNGLNGRLSAAFPTGSNNNDVSAHIHVTGRSTFNGYGVASSSRGAHFAAPHPHQPSSSSSSSSSYAYPEPSTGQDLSYPTPSNVYGAETAYPAAAAAAAAATAAATDNSTASAAVAAGEAADVAGDPALMFATTAWYPSTQSWHRWTGRMAGSLEPQDCYSASALMQLGGRALSTVDAANANANANANVEAAAAAAAVAAQASVAELNGGDNSSGAAGAGASIGVPSETAPQSQAPWPLMIFDLGQGDGS
ncbi:MAG: hypothetical protein M1825_002855 [Sarcosagium campestre]|nr:MAG: hypothetical protein M1825_002855 [Sarcosagium campestre]